jgi:hypothetical protein
MPPGPSLGRRPKTDRAPQGAALSGHSHSRTRFRIHPESFPLQLLDAAFGAVVCRLAALEFDIQY